MIKVKDDPSIVRDPLSGAILNINTDEYLAHMAKKDKNKNTQRRLDVMESDIQEIKSMFSLILEKLK